MLLTQVVVDEFARGEEATDIFVEKGGLFLHDSNVSLL